MSIEAWNKRLTKASEFLKQGKTIWWAREPFHDAKFREQIPKWHLFQDRAQLEQDKYSYVWTAKCGYQHIFNEGMLERFPKLNLSNKPPAKRDQCKMCLRKIGQ